MKEPIFTEEPTKAEARSDTQERTSLHDAYQSEIALLREASKATGSSDQAEMFVMVAASLDRVINRWRDDAKYSLDIENRKFVKTK